MPAAAAVTAVHHADAAPPVRSRSAARRRSGSLSRAACACANSPSPASRFAAVAIAAPSRRASATGSASGSGGRVSGNPASRRSGPITRPGAPGVACTRPSTTRAVRASAGVSGSVAPNSPKPSSISRSTSASTAAASPPEARISTGSPPRRRSPTTPSTERRSTAGPSGAPIRTSTSRPFSVLTSSAAGRACRPSGFRSVTVADCSGPVAAGSAPAAAAPASSCSARGCSRGRPGGGRHRVEVGPALRGDGGRNGPLHQRGVDHDDPSGLLRIAELQRGLGGQQRRSKVVQDDRTIAALGLGDGTGDQVERGADAAVVGPAGGCDGHRRGHLTGQLGGTGRDVPTVRNQDQPDRHPGGPVGRFRPQRPAAGEVSLTRCRTSRGIGRGWGRHEAAESANARSR